MAHDIIAILGAFLLSALCGFLFIPALLSFCKRKNLPFSAARVILAYSLLIVPTFDVVRVIIHRLRIGKPIFDADKSHIHHKLMAVGLSQHYTLGVILLLELCFVGLNLIIYEFVGKDFNALLITDIFLYTVFNVALTRFIKAKAV